MVAECRGEAGARGFEAVLGGLERAWAACSAFDIPATREMVSGKVMLKNLVSGSRYFSLISLVDTFLTTTVLVYSPPGSQPAGHSRPSPQSTPKRLMRALRPSGSGRDAIKPAWPDNAGSLPKPMRDLTAELCKPQPCTAFAQRLSCRGVIYFVVGGHGAPDVRYARFERPRI